MYVDRGFVRLPDRPAGRYLLTVSSLYIGMEYNELVVARCEQSRMRVERCEWLLRHNVGRIQVGRKFFENILILKGESPARKGDEITSACEAVAQAW